MHHILIPQPDVASLVVDLECRVVALSVGQHLDRIHEGGMIRLAGFLLQLAQAADAGRIRFLAHDGQTDPYGLGTLGRGHGKQAFGAAPVNRLPRFTVGVMALAVLVDDVLRVIGPHADHDHIRVVLLHQLLKLRGPIEIVLTAEPGRIFAFAHHVQIRALAQSTLEHGPEPFHHHGVAHEQHQRLAFRFRPNRRRRNPCFRLRPGSPHGLFRYGGGRDGSGNLFDRGLRLCGRSRLTGKIRQRIGYGPLRGRA